MFSKKTAIVLSFIIAVAILWPITENFKRKPADSFPLSYYPMFSSKRGSGYSLNYIIGYDAANTRYYIPYKYIGSGGLNQVRIQLNKKVKRKDTDKILQKVEKRLIKRNEPPYNQLVKLELIRGRFDFDAYYLSGNKLPQDEKTLAIKLIEKP